MKIDDPEDDRAQEKRAKGRAKVTAKDKVKDTVKKMGKSAKKAPAASRDLFDLPQPAGRRSAGRGKAQGSTPARAGGAEGNYTARDIEVLEGLEPVRRRPGMYIGGTDEKALHHLFAEVI